MIRLLLLLAALALGSLGAQAQTVQQSGGITPNHLACWATTGVIQDCGAATSGRITDLGVYKNGGLPDCITAAAVGRSSFLPASTPYTQFCQTVTVGDSATLSLQSYNGAAAAALQFNINGTIYPCCTASGLNSITNIAALRANTSTLGVVYVDGYYTASDGGEGMFVQSSDVCVDNGGTIIVDAASHCFYRGTQGQINSVKWFGAKGDGSTNDTARVQAAVDVGPTFFPAGTYLLGSAVTLASNAWLSGEGKNSLIKTTASNTDAFQATGTVAGSVNLNSNGTLGATSIVLASGGSSYTAGDYVLIVGSSTTGVNEDVEINQVTNVSTNTLTLARRLSNNYLTSNGAYAKRITALRQNIVIQNLGFQTSRYPLSTIYSKNVAVVGCYAVGDAGLLFQYSENVQVRTCDFDTSAAQSAVQTNYTRFASISGSNVFRRNAGFQFIQHSDQCSAVGNSVSAITISAIEANNWSQYCTVSGNTLLSGPNPSGYGVLFDNGSSGGTIAGNTVNLFDTAIFAGEGYQTVTGNTVYGYGTLGISLEDATNDTVTGNLIDTNISGSLEAIAVRGTSGGVHKNTIANNVIRNITGNAGIYIDGTTGGGTGNVVTGNQLNQTASGFFFRNLSQLTLRSNSVDLNSGGGYINSDDTSMATAVGDKTITYPIPVAMNGTIYPNFVPVFTAPDEGVIGKFTFMWSAASDAAATSKVRLDKLSGGSYVNFNSSATLKSQTQYSAMTFTINNASAPTEAVLLGGVTAPGDVVGFYHDPNGSTNTGIYTWSFEWFSMGGG